MKKNKILTLIIIVLIGICGCNAKESTKEIRKENGMIHEHCMRAGNAGSGTEVELSYEIYYTSDILNKIESKEEVKTQNKETLDLYENAYKKIQKNYEGLKYYDAKVERTEQSVTSYITINYDKIDIDKLIEIEGEDGNIFEEKIPKVAKWKELAKKVGTKCSIVE